MRTKYLLGLGVVMLVGLLWRGDADAQEIMVIAHKGRAVSLSKEEVKQIFLGQKTLWDDNTAIHFVVYTEENSYNAFLKSFIKKSPTQFTNYWKKRVFTGKGIMPKMFKDAQKVLEFVSNTEGAISFGIFEKLDADSIQTISVVN